MRREPDPTPARSTRAPLATTALLAAAAIACLCGLPAGAAAEPPSPSGAGWIVRADPRFDSLVPKEALLEKIADGFAWVEGPAWSRAGGYLLFSDIPANSVMRWKQGRGVDLFLKPSGYTGRTPFVGREPGSNGLTFDLGGRLVLCEHGDRRITRLEAGGGRTVLADRLDGRRLNSPNDAFYAPNGDLYFTDPPFGLPGALSDPARELDFSGVYRLTKDGGLALLTREVRAPNGIALAPSGKVLYVSNADPARPVWLAFDLRDDGSLGPGRLLRDASDWSRRWKGAPDGMKVDSSGNLWAAGPGGVHVLSPGGAHLGSILTGVATSNCAWGEDGSVLYITASTAVYRIRTTAKGLGF